VVTEHCCYFTEQLVGRFQACRRTELEGEHFFDVGRLSK
jgi:hypothetical protein